MEERQFAEYLKNPDQVQIALNLLDDRCLELGFDELFANFQNTLGIQRGEGFPVTCVQLSGLFCRARLNTPDFKVATSVSQIGMKPRNILQGRANPSNRSVFYASNNFQTAACEILQEEIPGNHIITIGCWKSENELRVANFIDGSDPDFVNLAFSHSMPKSYLNNWPDLPRKSALSLTEYFKEKFKKFPSPGLYNITNVIAAICYSLKEIEGIGYAAISNRFNGVNFAFHNPEKLKCVEVERWLIHKIDHELFKFKLLQKGELEANGSIIWNADNH